MDRSSNREDTFRRVYESHYRHIAAYARRRVSEHEVDDVIAETFLVAWRRMEDIPEGDLTVAWLYGVARRILSQGDRSGRRRARLAARLGSQLRPEEVAPSETDRLAEGQVVRIALSRLRPDDQELLRLAEWEGLVASELAHVLGCSTNAIAIRLHRAHGRFRRALVSIEGEDKSDAEERFA